MKRGVRTVRNVVMTNAIIAIIAGVLIIAIPDILRWVVGLWLVINGLMQLAR